MARKKTNKQLRTGETFIATDKLNRTMHYQFVGIDLQDLESGTGCQYIMLRNLDMGTHTNVEAQWFAEREITII